MVDPNTIPGKTFFNVEKDAGGYVISNVKTIIEKVNRISDNLISLYCKKK